MGVFEVIGLAYLAWLIAKSQGYDVGDFPFNFPG